MGRKRNNFKPIDQNLLGFKSGPTLSVCSKCHQSVLKKYAKYCRDCNINYCSDCYEDKLYVIIINGLMICETCIKNHYEFKDQSSMPPKKFNQFTFRKSGPWCVKNWSWKEYMTYMDDIKKRRSWNSDEEEQDNIPDSLKKLQRHKNLEKEYQEEMKERKEKEENNNAKDLATKLCLGEISMDKVDELIDENVNRIVTQAIHQNGIFVKKGDSDGIAHVTGEDVPQEFIDDIINKN